MKKLIYLLVLNLIFLSSYAQYHRTAVVEAKVT